MGVLGRFESKVIRDKLADIGSVFSRFRNTSSITNERICYRGKKGDP